MVMSTEIAAPVAGLAKEVVALLRARARDLALDDGMIASIRPRGPVVGSSLPVVDRLADYAALASPQTAPVVRAVAEAARHLFWRRTYSQADGSSPDHIERYGWFDLVGPKGPYSAEGLRIHVGCWGQGLVYPDHSHDPEEHYLVLAGGARFRLGRENWQTLGPGGIFRTPPGAVHSADMRDQPLMALAIWRAADVSIRINLTETGRDVTAD